MWYESEGGDRCKIKPEKLAEVRPAWLYKAYVGLGLKSFRWGRVGRGDHGLV